MSLVRYYHKPVAPPLLRLLTELVSLTDNYSVNQSSARSTPPRFHDEYTVHKTTGGQEPRRRDFLGVELEILGDEARVGGRS